MIPRTLFSEEHEIFRQSVRRFMEAVSYTHLTLPTNREV